MATGWTEVRNSGERGDVGRRHGVVGCRKVSHPPVMIAGLEPDPSRARPTLSEREHEVLRMWVMTDSKSAAARRLFLSESTVSTHITRIRQKYDDVGRPARTKAGLLIRALQDGHIRLDELD